MTIEEKMKEKSRNLHYPDREGTGYKHGGVYVGLSDAIRIAKEYAEECCKRQLHLTIAKVRDEIFAKNDIGVVTDYLGLRNAIETTKLATEDE